MCIYHLRKHFKQRCLVIEMSANRGICGVATLFPHCQHGIQTALAGMTANPGVLLGRLLTQFPHITEHQHLEAAHGGQGIDARQHGFHAGIVGIIHQGQTAPALHAEAPLDRCHLLQPRLDTGEGCAEGQTARGGSQRIGHVVATRDRQSQAQLALRGHHHELGAALLVEHKVTRVERLTLIVDGEGALNAAFPPLRPEFVVSVDDGGATLAQPLKNFALGVEHPFQRAEALQMGRRHVVDDGGIGFGQ